MNCGYSCVTCARNSPATDCEHFLKRDVLVLMVLFQIFYVHQAGERGGGAGLHQHNQAADGSGDNDDQGGFS